MALPQSRRGGRGPLLVLGLLLVASTLAAADAEGASANASNAAASQRARGRRSLAMSKRAEARRRSLKQEEDEEEDDKNDKQKEEDCKGNAKDCEEEEEEDKKEDDKKEDCKGNDKDCEEEEEDDKKPKTPEPTDEPTMPPFIADVRDTPSPAGVGPTYAPTDPPTISPYPTAFPSASPTRTTMPTASPSGSPSASPSAEPTAVPSAAPTDSAMPSMSPLPYQRSDRVDLRYQPWASLIDDQQSLAAQLGYDQLSWNELGLNPTENQEWADLTREQKNAARALGYDNFSWDCWQNHFQGYRWINLDDPYIQAGQWWKTLGWDIYKWNQYQDAPESDGKSWYELSDEERYAAAQLCYTRESWDEGDVLVDGFPIRRPEFRYTHWYDLTDDTRTAVDERLKYSALTWNVLGLGRIEGKGWEDLTPYEEAGAVSAGFTPLTWDCWQNHFRSYDWEDLVFWGLDQPYSQLGWTELKWNGDEPAPASASLTWKDLTPAQRQAAAMVCYFRDNWDGTDMTPNYSDFPHPKVKQRYVMWTALPVEIRFIAKGLGYTRKTWDELGTAEIEQLRWEELTEAQKADAMTLGFYSRTWDCFHNHYRSYEWVDIDRDSRDALQNLGWNEANWATSEEPPSYSNAWDNLSDQEQAMANDVCFFKDNWDGNALVADAIEEDPVPPKEVDPADPNADPNAQQPTFTDLGGGAPGASIPDGSTSSVNMLETRRAIVSTLLIACGMYALL